jgi:hypothetical protein
MRRLRAQLRQRILASPPKEAGAVISTIVICICIYISIYIIHTCIGNNINEKNIILGINNGISPPIINLMNSIQWIGLRKQFQETPEPPNIGRNVGEDFPWKTNPLNYLAIDGEITGSFPAIFRMMIP